MLLTTTTSLGARLAITIAGLYAIVAPKLVFEPARVAFWILVLNRLNRMVGRLDRLVAHFRAGTLPAPRPSRAGQPRPKTDRPDQPRLPPIRLPRGHAWLVRLIQRTVQFGPLVEALINSPEGAALLAAAPQAARIFRPLCRMLGIDPPAAIRPPPRPKRPRPPRPAPQPAPPMHPISPIGFRPQLFNFSAPRRPR